MSTDNVESTFLQRTSRWKLIILLLVLALIITVIISLGLGSTSVPVQDILTIIGKRIPFLDSFIDSSSVSAASEAIILEARLPRIIAGVLIGAALAAAGVLYQGVFKNPMADSYVLGVSAGAAVGASASILVGAGFVFFEFRLIQVAAFIGALSAMFLVYNLARVGSRVPVTTLLLCGIAVNFFLFAVVGVLEIIAANKLHDIVFWLMGGYSNVYWQDIWAILPFIVIGIVVAFFYVRDLNLLAMGEETAHHLGVNVERSKQILLVLASLITAAAVSVCGLIGFVGLMIPHLTRLLIGPDHRILLPTSTIIGAIFLVLCDDLARVLSTLFSAMSTRDWPVGIITMLFGAPFFVFLLKKKKQSYAA
ncbi:iron chelate uptake ABC transporter family permease subunit [Candidatus Bathyarchaeota archaeon]|nr:iron chelate uptake ABC transporter family permease subunit [Candidatus Bathyarchaeota archaeon]